LRDLEGNQNDREEGSGEMRNESDAVGTYDFNKRHIILFY